MHLKYKQDEFIQRFTLNSADQLQEPSFSRSVEFPLVKYVYNIYQLGIYLYLHLHSILYRQ